MNVFVTCWNRHTWMIPLLDDFAKAGLIPIVIDNNSTFPACVEYLKKCPYKVIHMKENFSAWAFFTSGLYQEYKDKYFLISDSDMSIENVPSDWVEKILFGLEHETEDNVWKSGLSQEINDLPDNPYANEIREYERKFWTNQNKYGFYKTWLDLGIAIYDRERRGENPIKEDNWYCAIRSPRPYTSRHLDWYATPDSLREEDLYYLNDKTRNYDGWLMNLRTKYHLV